MFARPPASPPCSCPLRLSPSGKTVDPEAPLPASPVCDRDSTRRFHGAHSRLIRLLHSSLRPHALLPQDKQVGIAAGDAPQPVHGRKGLASDTGSSHRWLAGLLGRSVGSLPSAGVTRLRRYYEPVRPCASHRYSAPQGSAPWRSPLEVSLGIEATGSHVPHKSLSLVSRRLHAGRRSASRQAPAELCRRPTTGAWFWRRPYAFDTSATVHSRSSDQRTPDGIAPAFCRNAHHLGHWTDAACGGLDPDPAIRARGTDPHLLCSKAARSCSLHLAPPRAVVAHGHPHIDR